jgi:hypothetical protein
MQKVKGVKDQAHAARRYARLSVRFGGFAMPSAAEGAQAAGEEQAHREAQLKLENATPKISMLQHIAATQGMEMGFTVLLLDGGSYSANKGEYMFTDGLSFVSDDHRVYIPITAIKAIRINNPGKA